MEKIKKSLWQILSISGFIGIIIYFAHVILGGILWDSYNPITQTISELTSGDAPNKEILSIFTAVYGVLLVIFSFSMYFIFKKFKVHKVAIIGSVLLIIMETSSFIGYNLFPLTSVTEMNFQNAMHIVVTIVVVVCSIAAIFFVGIGLIKTDSYKRIGIFVLICAIIFTASGSLTPISMANNLRIAGLTERINIFTLQICLSVLSVSLFKSKKS